MKFKALLFAAAGLLAVANAAKAPPSASPTYPDKMDGAAPKVDVPILGNDAHLEDLIPGDCKTYCDVPLEHCLLGCSGCTEDCHKKCSCGLFSNRHSLCRIKSCVKEPEDCSIDQMSRSSPRLVDDALVDDAPIDDAPVDDAPVDYTLVHDDVNKWQCLICYFAISSCLESCDGTPECRTACRCYYNPDSPWHCTQCDVGQTCNGTSREIALDHILDRDPADASSLSPTKPADKLVPLPCDICQISINGCKKRCGKGPQCDQDCRCENKANNPMCKNCWAATCDATPRAISSDDNSRRGLEEASELELATDAMPRPPPPNNPCVNCRMAINMCTRRCGGGNACTVGCNCEHKDRNFNCKICESFHPRCSWSSSNTDDGSEIISPRDRPFGPSKHDPTKIEASIDPSKLPPGLHPDPRVACPMCGVEIEECKKKCGKDAACTIGCQCEKKHTSINCIFCPSMVFKCEY